MLPAHAFSVLPARAFSVLSACSQHAPSTCFQRAFSALQAHTERAPRVHRASCEHAPKRFEPMLSACFQSDLHSTSNPCDSVGSLSAARTVERAWPGMSPCTRNTTCSSCPSTRAASWSRGRAFRRGHGDGSVGDGNAASLRGLSRTPRCAPDCFSGRRSREHLQPGLCIVSTCVPLLAVCRGLPHEVSLKEALSLRNKGPHRLTP